jgi:octopine/nopaline transport system substrate-binding protein
VQGAATVARIADQSPKDVAEVREYVTTELAAGRVDILMASTGYLTKKPGNVDITLTGPRFFGGLFGKGSSVGLRKSDPESKAMFNDAIAAAKADGTVKRLSEK